MSEAEPFPLSDAESELGLSDALEFGAPQAQNQFDESQLGQSNSVFGDAVVLSEPLVPYQAPQPVPVQAPTLRPAGRVVVSDDLSRRERRRRVKLQARKVRRIIRHIEPWSVLKISFVFYLCLWVILVLAGVMLWSVAVSSGTVERAEGFVADLFALDEFLFDASIIFRAYSLGALVLVIAGTAFNVLLCVLFNLISDLMGGVRLTVIEEESARFRPPRRRVQRRSR